MLDILHTIASSKKQKKLKNHLKFKSHNVLEMQIILKELKFRNGLVFPGFPGSFYVNSTRATVI